MFEIFYVRVTCSKFQKALSHKNNLIKGIFFLSFAEDEVPSDQEIIDVSFPVKWVSTQIRVRKVLTINYTFSNLYVRLS